MPDVLNLACEQFVQENCESILDTIYTLQAMPADVFVVREASAGIREFNARNVQPHVSVLNAGEADVSHPTQALLVLMTIRLHQKNAGRPGCHQVLGDLRHSRVARSAGRRTFRGHEQ